MENYNPKFDEYIAKAPAYAQPIIEHLRELIHRAEPQVTEVIKWGHPCFDFQGPAVSMAAFKQHIGVNFWKRALMDDPAGIFKIDDGTAGNLGKISSQGDLPSDEVLLAYFHNAFELNRQGVKTERKAKAPKAELEVPDYLIEAFKTHTKALAYFEQFSPSAKREYLEWLIDAKSEATRTKRLETMMEWVSEGKTRNWKYKNC